jgi:NACalpha-BTF3-like transcription factor
MIATGIPPHLALTNELCELIEGVKKLQADLERRFTELPNELTNMVLSKFSINGAIPVTMDDLKRLLGNAVKEMRAEVRQALPDRARASAALELVELSATDSRFKTWTWGGRMHPVPQDWQFPSTDVKATWNMWHFGHVHDGVRPLRDLKQFDLTTKAQVVKWSKCTRVMKAVAQVMVEMKVVESVKDVITLSATDSSNAFDGAIVRLMEQVREGSTRGRGRWMEMSIPTLYDHINAMMIRTQQKTKQSRRKRTRVEEEERKEEERKEEEEEMKE